MSKSEHFLITRFNVLPEFDIIDEGSWNREWLTHRFNLFEKFCYPSVLNQSNQNFKWIVFFHSKTPEDFKQKISEYAKWENFIPVYLDDRYTIEYNRLAILNNLSAQPEYLITSRLDSDDAISIEYIETIQNNFAEQEFEFLNFSYGYVLNGGKLYLFKYLQNPFVSLVERVNELSVNGFKTVLCADHTELYSHGKVKQIKTETGWMQIIHGKNNNNRVRGIRQSITKLNHRFIIDIEHLPQEEKLLPFLVDKMVSLLKHPFDSLIISLPKDTRARLRKFCFSLATSNCFKIDKDKANTRKTV